MDIFGGHSSHHRSQPREGLGMEVSTPNRGKCMCKGLKARMDWACSWNSKAALLESDNTASFILINFLHGVNPTSEGKCGALHGPRASRTTLVELPLALKVVSSIPPLLAGQPSMCLEREPWMFEEGSRLGPHLELGADWLWWKSGPSSWYLHVILLFLPLKARIVWLGEDGGRKGWTFISGSSHQWPHC